MKAALLVALGALPGTAVFALAALGVRDEGAWYHPVGLLAFYSTMLTVGVSALVWAVDKIARSPRTARLRSLAAVACGVSAALTWTAASLAYSSGTSDAIVFLVPLPVPIVAAAVLGNRSGPAPRA